MDPSFQHCPDCGGRLVVQTNPASNGSSNYARGSAPDRYCPYCGAANPPFSEYCGRCGKSMQ
jgi:predicted nucleic acid-binding Zn ribbon protein